MAARGKAATSRERKDQAASPAPNPAGALLDYLKDCRLRRLQAIRLAAANELHKFDPKQWGKHEDASEPGYRR